ncbi:MAG: hypothetical protein IJT88_09380 [Kiritimatiellae bacterium]|nr:hypothetical protein [Kiritimatiellia bacterium]
MGSIHQDAQRAFFDSHKSNADLIKLFLSGFDITAAYEKHVSNTTVYAYILKPESFMKEAFGFEKDILLMYSPYKTMEPRAIQALDELFHLYPFVGRVDTLNCFLLSDDKNVEIWVKESANSENFRIIIPFSKNEMLSNKGNTWFIRNKLIKYCFGLDLFGYTLPLSDDTYFFGRQQIVAHYINSIKRGENRGVFGLRKTGKTSLLYKIKRIVSEQKIGELFFYDCKIPSFRKLHWIQFLYEIYSNICNRINVLPKRDDDETTLIRNMRTVIKEAANKGIKIILVFDEIEYVSFIAPLDEHWKTEFVDFWQTLWSIQSTHRNLTFIVSGVNASVTEIDSIVINGRRIQNPLFGIVQSEYLKGLTEEECNSMIKTLGKRMGLKFEHDVIRHIYAQYGGHPMLTRLACSKLNMYFEEANRPVTITLRHAEQLLPDINADLIYYFKHVISELQEFYPDEYDMFEMLAVGQIVDYMELSQSVELTKHLYDYGLINNEAGYPKVNLPVAGDFVASELAKKEQRQSAYKLIPPVDRSKWVVRRAKAITQDLRQLEIAISQANGLPKLFGNHSFPEADKLLEIPVADSESNFIAFTNILNRCFVESMENYGKEIGKNNYFWNDIRMAYPALFAVLYRAKVYRHSQDHLTLTPQVKKDYASFRAEDTAGIADPKDQLYAIQQKLLNSLWVAIQVETNKII